VNAEQASKMTMHSPRRSVAGLKANFPDCQRELFSVKAEVRHHEFTRLGVTREQQPADGQARTLSSAKTVVHCAAKRCLSYPAS
jgi:hypothetical protein